VKILFFEDKGSVNTYVTEALERNGHQVFCAFNVNDAQSHWEDQAIDAIILDLSVDPEGLTESQLEQTEGGLLTGWIWLRDNVLADHPDFSARTIIFTEYGDDLIRAVPPSGPEGVTMIWKRQEDQITRLLEAVGAIQARLA
jgi:hypothetical protein